jgi:RNA polymerase-binding transcription factor DksA
MDGEKARVEKIKQMLRKKERELENQLRLSQEILKKELRGVTTPIYLLNCHIPHATGNRILILKQRLINVQWAFIRLKNGTYGFCLSCGKEIPWKRLEAVPEAKRCVECQMAFV